MPHSDHVRGRAVAFGHDQVLLRTRERLLEADGYRTSLFFDLEEVLDALANTPHYDILVLCHTVNWDERRAIEAIVATMPAPVPLYAMKGADSPQTFTQTVARLTGKQQILG